VTKKQGIVLYLTNTMPTDTIFQKGGKMKRTKMSPKKDKKMFKKTSKPHPANTVKFVMRGGIRK